MPTGSSRRSPLSFVSATSSGTARASARKKGMFAKKIQRQPSHPAPAEPRGEEAPEGRPQCHGDAGDHPHDAERTGPLSDVRKGDCDECGPARGHEGCACSLYDAHGQEHRFAQSHPARDRSDEKHRIAGQHAAPATEAVGKGAGRKEGAGEGKTIGVDDPGQAGNAQSNVFRDGGHRDHDRRHIEQYQESA